MVPTVPPLIKAEGLNMPQQQYLGSRLFRRFSTAIVEQLFLCSTFCHDFDISAG